MSEFEGYVPSEASKETFSPAQELKMDLFAQGICPTDRARAAIQGPEEKPLTTGDYVSTDGIILQAGEYVTINAPFPDNNPFAKDTPNVLDFQDGKFLVTQGADKPVEVKHIAPPHI